MAAALTYPQILNEHETLLLLQAGNSIARYGDGELKLCRGASIKSQPHSGRLQTRLLEILAIGSTPRCVVGIPNIWPPGTSPKERFWSSFRDKRYLVMYRGGGLGSVRYGSSFISRPDSAPAIDNERYWTDFRALWAGRDVILIRGSDKSLTQERVKGARSVREIRAPIWDAFREYDGLLARVKKIAEDYPKPLVLACLGPTATVLAWDLAQWGIQCLDLGHAGMFLKRQTA